MRQPARADYFFRLVLPSQVSAARASAEGRDEDEVARPRRRGAAGGFDELDDGAVVGRLVRIAGGEPAAHRSHGANDCLRVGHVLVEPGGVGELGDQGAGILPQRVPLRGLRSHVRDDGESRRPQVRNERASDGAGGARDEDRDHGGSVYTNGSGGS